MVVVVVVGVNMLEQVDLAKAGEVDGRANFYSNLYMGLFAEAKGEIDKARTCEYNYHHH